MFPQFPRAERWLSLGGAIVHGHIQTCVRNDGSYFEQSTYYHMYALDMFAFHASLEPVPPPYLEKLKRTAEFLAAIVSEGGELPFLGDDDGGRFFHPYGARQRFARASLAVASLLVGERFFAYNRRDSAEIAAWWLGPERCQHVPAASFEDQSRVFNDSGIVVMRHGPVVAVVDAGPFGPGSAGHSHSDTLALVVTVGDQEVLIDSGAYSYMDPEWRAYFRGSAAHNTIRIDGKDQGVAAGPFRWMQKPEVKLLDSTTDTGPNRVVGTCSYQGFTHTRKVEFANSEFSVTDEIAGPAGEHDVEQFWHFAVEPRELSAGKWAIGDLAEFTPDGGVVEPAWRSRCLGTKKPAWVIVVRRRAALPFELHAHLRLKP